MLRPRSLVAVALTCALLGGGGAWAWSERAGASTGGTPPVVTVVDDGTLSRARDAAGARAAGSQAASTARAALGTAVSAAQATVDASSGRVGDEAVRTRLRAVLDEAAAQLAAVAPTSPPAGTAGGLPAGTTSPATWRELAARVVAAQREVVEAQAQWQADQAAAAASPATGTGAGTGTGTAGSGPASSAPSCATTYSGPPFFTSPPTQGGDGSNGRLPPSALTALTWAVDPLGTPYYLRTAAAAALERLDVAFVARFGHHLDLDLTYRDYDTQVAMRAALGTVAATPGTSSHGTGLALDVPELPCEYGYGTAQRDWLVANGPSYGWVAPSWAAPTGSNPEYWHFEYRG